jgi:UDP-glucose 4-epimerase
VETWLLTGGAGYIGGHVLRALRAYGHTVVVLDLPEARASSVARVPADVPVVQASVLDRAAVEQALVEHAVDGVIHLAARKSVGESVERPAFYYRENVDGTLAVVEAMAAVGVRRIVYSSSAAVYGTPPTEVVVEDAPTAPLNPYGRSKLAAEWVVEDAARALGWGAVSLRYFNVVGTADPALADSSGSNLFPRVLAALAQGEPPVVNGTDYPTRDGSCVRSPRPAARASRS